MTEPQTSSISNGLKKIFLAPRSNETAYKNFVSSMQGRHRDEIIPHLSLSDAEVLGEDERFFIWGCQPSLRSRWEKLNVGDYVLFYARGMFIAIGELKFKTENRKLAESLWPVNKETNEPWSCLFFVENVKTISVSLEKFNSMTGYKLKMVQGFMHVTSAQEKIRHEYGSTDNFIRLLESTLSQDETIELVQLAKTPRIDLSKEDIARIDDLTRNRTDEEINAALIQHTNMGLDKTPEQLTRVVKVYERNRKLVRDMKDKYKNECQICGFTFVKSTGGLYSEAAHVIGIYTGEKGVDVPDNIWILCANHHKMLDLGAIEAILPDHYIENGATKRLMVS